MKLQKLLCLFGFVSIFAASAAAQENLGRNAGTGETKLRVGSWKLIRIKTTAAGFSIPRQSKDLPVDTRERKGISWGYGTRRITADLVFKDLKETVVGSSAGTADVSLKVLVKGAVTGKGVSQNPETDAVGMQCMFYLGAASGQMTDDYGAGRNYLIYAGSNPAKPGQLSFSKIGEFECPGSDLRLPSPKPEEGFTLNYRLRVYEYYPSQPYEGDVTFHFYYEWAGWNPDTPGRPQVDTTFSSLDAILSLLVRLYSSLAANPQKLSEAYADISMIADKWASNAVPVTGQEMKVGSDWQTYKAMAAKQGPKASLELLQQKVSATFKPLKQSQQNTYVADISSALQQAGSSSAGPQKDPAQPVKAAFTQNDEEVRLFVTARPNDSTVVNYDVRQGFGWDHISIVEPAKIAVAAGNFGAIDNRFVAQISSTENDRKPRQGTITFPGLPPGHYAARYTSWDGGNNRVVAEQPFTVGSPENEPSSPPPGGTPPANPPGSSTPAGSSNNPNPAKDLTGLWKNPGGQAIYRVRQIGSKFVWGMDAVSLGSFANMFQGQISGDTIDGVWEDLPGSPSIGGGRMLLKIESECRFSRVSSVNRYGADIWVKIGSKCEIVGLTTKTATNSPPKSDESKSTGPIVLVSDPFGAVSTPTDKAPASNAKTNPPPKVSDKAATVNKPKVEEIPDDISGNVSTGSRTSSTQKPKVEEIPDDPGLPSGNRGSTPRNTPKVEEIPETPVTTSSGSESGNSTAANTSPVPQPKPKKTPKPKDPNGGFWDNLGRAIGDTVRAANTQPGQTTGGNSTGGSTGSSPQGDSGCHGGAFGLGAPVIERVNDSYAVLKFPWSTPAGDSGSMIRVFRAGTNQEIVNGYLPSSSTSCGYSYPINWDLNQFAGTFDAYLYDRNGSRVIGPVRYTVNR